MAWIKTIPPAEADETLLQAMEAQRSLYPKEYGHAFDPVDESIVMAHSLFPKVLYHSFAAFGEMMSPDLPLARRDHELIATMVSLTNACRN